MVAIRFFASLFLTVLIAACSENNKTTATVFPENNKPTPSSCSAAQVQRIPTQFIVSWEDGRITKELAENADVFQQNFIKTNLRLIKHVEFDKKVHLIHPSSNNSISAESVPANWGQEMIHASAAWSQNIKGKGVLVAVVDTAIDKEHPLLKNNFVLGYDYVTNTEHPGYSKTMNEHATHVAGVIAGQEGVASMQGVAPEAQVLGVSFLDENGEGDLSNGITAMKFAADHGAKIINNSWGGDYCSQTMKTVMQSLESKGVLIVVAAGNEFSDLDSRPTWPAAFNTAGQVTVAAASIFDIMSNFSNSSWDLVHLAAPGQDIYSSVPGGKYALLSGTSMATPFVSGAAALLLSLKPNATPEQIKSALLKSVDVRSYRVLTQGRLNIQSAVEEIKKLVP